MTLHPPEDKLIVEVAKPEEKTTESGIIIEVDFEDTAQEHPHDTIRAKVLYVGKDVRKLVKENEFILFEQRVSAPCVVFGVDCKSVRYKDILGVIKDEK